MFGFGKHRGKKKVEINVIEETVIVIEGQKWFHEHHKHHKKVELVLTTFINNSKLRIMSLQLSSKQFALGSLALIDSDTQAQVTATFANPQFTGDNDAAFTVAPDASDPNTARVTGVAAGTGNVTASADATYTDANTGQQVTKSVSVVVAVTVIAVVAGENVELQLNFGAPQDQP